MKRSRTCDQQTQTPENIEKETRSQRFKSFRLPFKDKTSLNLKLRFLGSRRKTGLTANAVATEQKATKVIILLARTIAKWCQILILIETFINGFVEFLFCSTFVCAF